MSDFLSSMAAEMGARRKRFRGVFGDRGASIVEFLVLTGLVAGSLGLFIAPWMPAAAPWGFAMPVVFALGYVLIERRRQSNVRARHAHVEATNDELDRAAWEATLVRAHKVAEFEGAAANLERDLAFEEKTFRAGAEGRKQDRLNAETAEVAPGYDWIAFFWSFACAVLGAAAFVIAWSARPVVEEDTWTPPDTGAVESHIAAPPP